MYPKPHLSTKSSPIFGLGVTSYLKAIDNHVYYPFYCITFYFRFSV
ncbi:hypothetical protein ROSINTL182_06957 [Roseburia intestinalis L1-82]|uniref:Uncharacterized protein n=1 Tax=Roseburia intestinalis L1-82 TaxID=536231 RepID=C7GAM7_9FIRM|nr:hypothetical protein ROSINTL182_06957 [Roseburia intestinalis L1-82]